MQFGQVDISSQTINLLKIQTKPYTDQKPGTSGLRKKVKIFQQPNYTQNFIQAYFNALRKDALSPRNSLLIGGDGRYLTTQVLSIICQIACANGVDELHIAVGGLMSTPACSAYIRLLNRQFGNCLGGILLTASHNPGGPQEDFGIKFNSRNGGPAQQQFTDSVYTQSKKLSEYYLTDYNFLKNPNKNDSTGIDLTKTGQHHFTHVNRPSKPTFTIKIVQNVHHYITLMKQQFDFNVIQKLFSRSDFKFVLDGMYGAAGPYAYQLFQQEFKSQGIKLLNCQPKPDFNHEHPDPNLKCAHELVKLMGVNSKQNSVYDFGAACDGDADRNMILGKNFFVTPSDSLAVLTANSSLFLKSNLKGVARSMPTSGAVDKVADKLNIRLFETPTGWKYFGNLMENDLISICGEQSFGTGSSHIRQKDGLWTILAWLQVLARQNQHTQIGKLKSIQNIVEQFWNTYGRNYYCRYDFQNCKTQLGLKVWQHIQQQIPKYKQGDIIADVFAYQDPVDKSKSDNQGIRFIWTDKSRVIFRQSGTGSSGMTIRIYFQKFRSDNTTMNQFEALKEMIDFGLKLSNICQITGKANPDVIT